MIDYVYQFFDSLLFSVVVESIVVLLLCNYFKRDKRIAFLAGLGTMLTIPYVWFVFPTIFWFSSVLSISLAEGFAFVFEAMLYKFLGKVTWKQAIIFSLLANGASYFLGKII
jgi:hypothetical protein